MTTDEVEHNVTEAIKHSFKMKLRTADTPSEEYTLFRPNLLVDDVVAGRSIIGLVEEQQGQPMNVYAKPTLRGLVSAIVTDEKFDIPYRAEYINYHNAERDSILLDVNPILPED